MQRFSGFDQIKRLGATLVLTAVAWPGVLAAEPVAVRYTEGALHGFLVLRTLDDKQLAEGDLIQTVRGDRVTAHLVFRFKDGSILDQTTVYSQRQRFRLISDRLVQKGPTFPQPLEMLVDGITGQVTVRYEDEHGEHKNEAERLDAPPDLANGIVAKLLMNARPDMMPKTVSLIAATPKPRLVKLAITAAGLEQFSIGGTPRQATHYVLKVEIGGIAGLLAPLLGLQPQTLTYGFLGETFPRSCGRNSPSMLEARCGGLNSQARSGQQRPRRQHRQAQRPMTSNQGLRHKANTTLHSRHDRAGGHRHQSSHPILNQAKLYETGSMR